MSDQPEDRPTDVAGDLEYDEAHDVPARPQSRGGAQPGGSPVQVSNTTDDEGQDYGYDLAHEIPPSPGRGRDR